MTYGVDRGMTGATPYVNSRRDPVLRKIHPTTFSPFSPGPVSNRAWRAAQVSASYFSLLRVRGVRGRVFGADDDRPGAAPVVVLSETFGSASRVNPIDALRVE